ncbi:MaoC family dehydratase N-terminal domain-containing protein [Shouchella sp. JSM 1781072]|uniref:MaoC family dehydratase N-terminal domain-containing protein n=1 Tax=Bacillaceae TaxID=186817 RepID=UPI000C06B21E|nr:MULTISPECIES: MaoC family dehydratase N-terminal domain-containing protein [Bacillaceae]UTR07130.1 MaoC family dehydratase N-terminal domain-containing protein [Alkalihalobacillus sp. LMS6]
MTSLVADLFIGQIARLQRTFSDEDVRVCKELTNDYSPVYNSDQDVWKTYYNQPIVPGLLAEGLITQVVSEKLPGKACVLLQKELVFYRPVHVGDVITAELEIIDIHEERSWITQKVICSNDQGNEVIKGQIVILVLGD